MVEDPSCHEFHPIDFLLLLQGRKLVFIGDSMLTQMWQSMVCILQGVADSQLYVHWAKLWRCNDMVCPMGAKHSNCYGGAIFFPSLNTTLVSKKLYKYNKDIFFSTLSRLKVTKRDIILVNYGMHYNVEKEYNNVMQNFARDISDAYRTGKLTSHIAFLETTPQHYSNPNGYFSYGKEYGNFCVPLQYEQEQVSRDWRNIVARNALLAHPYVSLVQLAFGLYSQWDAHVAHEPMETPPWLDCTHWCFPSSALRYLMLIIYNSVRRLLLT